jgi:replicative DNA helicase
MADLVFCLLDRVQLAAESSASADAELPTGLAALDLAIGGLRAGDLIVLSGRPGSGKSSLLINLVRHISIDAGCPAAIVSLQSKGEHLLTRLASELSGIPLRRLNSGRLSDEEWTLLAEVAERLAAAPLLVRDQPVSGIDSIAAAAAVSAQKFGRCALVAIDHSQLLQVSPHASGEWTATLHGVCRELKLLARRHDCAMLLIEPADVRESLVDLLSDADVIMELRRTGTAVNRSSLELCELRVLKQQHGPPCTVQLQFAAATSRFRSL